MSHDVFMGIAGAITQADLLPLRAAGRLSDHAIVYRVERTHQGGGYGNQSKHPFTWAVAVYVEDQLFRVNSARGTGREWNSLDRLSNWLREQGFWCWWTRNDLEVVGTAETDSELYDPSAEVPPMPTVQGSNLK